VALNPAYTKMELDYCIEKVGMKAIIAPEVFRKQKHYEILNDLIPEMKDSKNEKLKSDKLKNVIIHSNKKHQ
jgi:medium-chain acyl-CoA ligase, mitochondrial